MEACGEGRGEPEPAATEGGRDWEAEDDFTLSNVWTEGLDLKKGIIYVRLSRSLPCSLSLS